MPIICVKSVKNYTGQKKFTRICSWGSWQISGMIRSITFWVGRARVRGKSTGTNKQPLRYTKNYALQVTALTTLPMIWKGVPSADPQGVLLYSLGVVSNDQSDPIYSHVWVCPDLRGVLLSMCVAKVTKQWSSKESRLSQISSFSDRRRGIMLATDCQDWAPTMFWF